MTGKQNYWIKNPMGRFALVEGVDERDRWTRVLGWAEAEEPGPNDLVHIVHPEVGSSQNPIPYEALAGGWTGLGWAAGPPPEPVDITKDPVLTDPAPAPKSPADEPAKPKTAAPAAGGDKMKE